MGGPSLGPATDDRREARRRLTEELATVDPIGTDLGWEGRLDEYGALADAIARQAEAGEPLRDAVVTVFKHECGFEPGREDLARICGLCGEPDDRKPRR